MLLKTIIDEDFSNYKFPSMFIATCYCNWKCCKEANIPITVCQNEPIASQPNIEVPTEELFRRYTKNPITQAVVFGGLEPILQFDEMFNVIEYFRNNGCKDDVVIYTGYNEQEILEQTEMLRSFPNIIIKYGRFVPNQEAHYDPILGVKLISTNQYGKRIS